MTGVQTCALPIFYLDGKELLQDKLQGLSNYGTGDFSWGDESNGSARLALAILLEKFSIPIEAMEKHQTFQKEFITLWPNGDDFDIEIPYWRHSLLD